MPAKTIKIKRNQYDIKSLNIPNVCFSQTDANDSREKQFKKQRISRGFDDSETFALYYTISKFILPRLIVFKESADYTHPFGITTKEWKKILDDMVLAFQLIIDGKHHEQQADVTRGLDAFHTWFLNLWN